jgi:mannose-6-phosphate isomerase
MNYETDERPWGRFIILDETNSHKVKRIEVKPNGILSYQFHNHRTEIWIITEGEATITIEGEISVLYKGDIVKIEQGLKHRVENKTDQILIFVEVQIGTYFGEDDIVRIEDIYNRK